MSGPTHVIAAVRPVTAVRREGASGVVYDGEYRGRRVAVKMYTAASSDGRPVDEVEVATYCSDHANVIAVVGVIHGPSLGLLLEFLEGVSPLGNPPNFDTVTRDVYAGGVEYSLQFALKVLSGVCAACGTWAVRLTAALSLFGGFHSVTALPPLQPVVTMAVHVLLRSCE